MLFFKNCFLQENHVNLIHIESRKSKRRNSEFEIFVDCDSNHEQLNEIIHLLRKHVNVVDMDPPDNSCLFEEGKDRSKRLKCDKVFFKSVSSALEINSLTSSQILFRYVRCTLVPKENIRLGQVC